MHLAAALTHMSSICIFADFRQPRKEAEIVNTSTPSVQSSGKEQVSEWVKKEPPSVLSESGYASIDELQQGMANRRIVPANTTNEKIPAGKPINYAELVFDEETDKPK